MTTRTILIGAVATLAIGVLGVTYLTQAGGGNMHPTAFAERGAPRATTAEATPAPTPTTGEGTEPVATGCTETMQTMMDQMHGEGSFDQMKAWMDERLGPGAFDAMHEDCTGGGMMGGSDTGGMMGGSDTGGMMGGSDTGGMMGGSDAGGMMGGASGGGMMGR